MGGGEEGENKLRSPGDRPGGASASSDEASLVEGLQVRADWARREGLEALSNLEPGADRGETIRRFYRMLEYAGSAVVRLDAPAAD